MNTVPANEFTHGCRLIRFDGQRLQRGLFGHEEFVR